MVWPMSLLQPGSACLDDHEDGLGQAGGPLRATAGSAEDLPALELGVGPLTGSARAGAGGVGRSPVARRAPSFTGVGHGSDLDIAQRIRDAVFVRGARSVLRAE